MTSQKQKVLKWPVLAVTKIDFHQSILSHIQ